MGLFEIPLAPVCVMIQCLKVVWPHTSAVTAKVIDSVPLWNGTDKQLMTDAMSCYVLAIDPDLAVAAASF